MLRVSCRRLLKQCFSNGAIDDKELKRLRKMLSSDKFHKETRTLLMMTILPRTLHEDSPKQAAYIKAALSRVIF